MLRFEELPEVNSERWLSLDDLEGEEWRDVRGFEKLLSISNYGRLKKKYHTTTLCKGGVRVFEEKICRVYNQTKGDYKRINVIVNNETHNLAIHRLVAIAFIENEQNYPYINHKDENPNNNCVYNLEWCTPKYNTNYGNARKKAKETFRTNGYNKAVVLYDYEGNIIEEFETILDASKKYATPPTICHCCQGKITTANIYHFRYKGDVYKKREIKKVCYHCIVYLNCEEKQYNSLSKCCSSLNISCNVLNNLLQEKISCINVLKGKKLIIQDNKSNMYIIENGCLTSKSISL